MTQHLLALLAEMKLGKRRRRPDAVLAAILEGELADDARALFTAWAAHEQPERTIGDFAMRDDSFTREVAKRFVCIGETAGGDLWVVARTSRGKRARVTLLVHDNDWAAGETATGLEAFLAARHAEGPATVARATAASAISAARIKGALPEHPLSKKTAALIPGGVSYPDPICGFSLFSKDRATLIDDARTRIAPIEPAIPGESYQIAAAFDATAKRCLVASYPAKRIALVDTATAKATPFYAGDVSDVAWLDERVLVRCYEAEDALELLDAKAKRLATLRLPGRITTWVKIPERSAVIVGHTSGDEIQELFLIAGTGTATRLAQRWEYRGAPPLEARVVKSKVYLTDFDNHFELVGFDAALAGGVPLDAKALA